MEDADSKSDDEAEDPTFKPSQDDIYDFESEASRDSYIARGFASLEGPAVKKARTTDEFIPDSNSETSIISMEIPNQWPGLVCDNSQEQATSPTSTAIEGKRKPAEGSKTAYDKKNFCTFCGKCSTKISRHLLSVHKDEMRVRPILFLEKRSTERMVNLELLANEGNFKHNMEVISKGSGFLVVARRSEYMDFLEYHDFFPCEFCKKFIRKSNLWHHHRQCAVKIFFTAPQESQMHEDASQNISNALRRGRNLLYSALMKNEDPHLVQLHSRMNDDDLKTIVFGDSILKRFCALRIDALGQVSDQKINDVHRVSQGARSLARLLKEVKKQNVQIKDMSDLLQPEHFDLVIKAAKQITFDSKSQPLTFARLIGNLIGHVIQVKAGTAIRNKDEAKLQEAQNFQRLFESEWNNRVNASAQKRINILKRNTVQTIPLTEDLTILLKHLKVKMLCLTETLKDSPSSRDWRDLSIFTLCRLILYNKRRRAEVKDLKISDYIERPDWRAEGGEEFENSLSAADKIMYEK